MKNPPNIEIIDLQAADLLKRAADILVKDGWRTFNVGSVGRPKCAIGAIAWAHSGNTEDLGEFTGAVERACAGLLREIGGTRLFDICSWNNNQTNANVVINTIRKAAQALVSG